MLTIELINEARHRIASRIHRTPVLTSRQFNEACGKEVFFKCENFQRAGAFKIRGATNKIQSLTPEEKQQGIVAFSSGNHAQAVALAGSEAGVRVLVAMPEDAPAAKVAATRDYGAEVVFYDRHKQDREAFALDLAERERLILVPPYDDYLILAGQATCGLELMEEVPARSMVTRITDTDLGYAGKWTYVFAAEGPDTRLTITEDGEVSNVIFRFLSRYAFGHSATIDSYLTSLGKQFGETVTPE